MSSMQMQMWKAIRSKLAFLTKPDLEARMVLSIVVVGMVELLQVMLEIQE